MRPAREGRENLGGPDPRRQPAAASMRPAREGRENRPERRHGHPGRADASMRPAREGRENDILREPLDVRAGGFNEARP